jgi:hypothetical protein
MQPAAVHRVQLKVEEILSVQTTKRHVNHLPRHKRGAQACGNPNGFSCCLGVWVIELPSGLSQRYAPRL